MVSFKSFVILSENENHKIIPGPTKSNLKSKSNLNLRSPVPRYSLLCQGGSRSCQFWVWYLTNVFQSCSKVSGLGTTQICEVSANIFGN